MPVGWPACVVPPSDGELGLNSASGWNSSFSQPVRNDSGLCRPVRPRPTNAGLSATVAGSFHELPDTVQTCGSSCEHLVGLVTSGLLFSFDRAQWNFAVSPGSLPSTPFSQNVTSMPSGCAPTALSPTVTP